MMTDSRRILRNTAVAVSAALMAALAAMLCSCTKTVYEPIETVRTEKEYVDRWRTDTLVQGDTRFVYIKGDTVIDWRDRWRERVREVHDTVYVERTDSVSVPYPIEKPLTRWEQAKLDLGGMAIGALALGVCAAVIWLIRRFRRR